jgi:hypothetical protein
MMARRKRTKYAKLLQEGDKYYQPDTQLGDIWTVKRVELQNNGWLKVFVENRTRAFILDPDDRVKLYYADEN